MTRQITQLEYIMQNKIKLSIDPVNINIIDNIKW